MTTKVFYFFCEFCGGDTAAYEYVHTCPYCHADASAVKLVGETTSDNGHVQLKQNLEEMRDLWITENRRRMVGQPKRKRKWYRRFA